jgi:hypothetical protein
MSLSQRFTSRRNITLLSQAIKRSAAQDVKRWVRTHDLDDYESVHLDRDEELIFANKEFIKKHSANLVPYELKIPGKYPKHYIDNGVENYNTQDFRTHDAYFTQEVFRTNKNFRYDNKIKSWETHLYKRHYERDNTEGLRDIRELNPVQRKFNMSKIVGPNPYKSSDSMYYGF